MDIYTICATACNRLQHYHPTLYATVATGCAGTSFISPCTSGITAPCLRLYKEQCMTPRHNQLPRLRSTCAGDVQAIVRDDLVRVDARPRDISATSIHTQWQGRATASRCCDACRVAILFHADGHAPLVHLEVEACLGAILFHAVGRGPLVLLQADRYRNTRSQLQTPWPG